LIRSALSLLNGIRDDQVSRDLLPLVLDQIVSYGDLIESKEINGQSDARLLYTSPPGFVEVSPERLLVLGISPDDVNFTPRDIAVEHHGHARVIKTTAVSGIQHRLAAAGLREIPAKDWLKAPQIKSAVDHVRLYSAELLRSNRPGTVD